MQNPNTPSGVPLPSAEVVPAAPGNPNLLAAAGAERGVSAAGLMAKNIVGSLAPLLPIVGIGFLTWWGLDLVTGRALSGKGVS